MGDAAGSDLPEGPGGGRQLPKQWSHREIPQELLSFL